MVKKKLNYVIGIDEVGRGALAGPVIVAALALPRKFKSKKSKTPLRDSKKLSARQREIWLDFIKKQKIPYATANASPKIIDKINISNAANLTAGRALKKLLTNNRQLTTNNCKVCLDGGLYINKLTINNLRPTTKNFKTTTIIKGDEKIPAISLASIVAKVSRDRYMKKLHKKYPRYDFINNVGYGVKKHVKAIKKYGLSSVHRRTFRCVR